METVIDAVATCLGSGVGWLAESGVLFIVFALMWAAFAVGLAWSQGSIDEVWQRPGG